MSFKISEFIFKKILRWKMIGTISSTTKKCVIIGAPHTSWHDFYIAVLFRNIVGVSINFIGKKKLFKPPFGFFFRYMGGVPVDRSQNQNLVETIASIFATKDEFRIAISPEGTRKKVDTWKTGFYYIAKTANVPIVMMTFDFGKKQIKVSQPYHLTDDKEKDFQYFFEFYKGVIGKRY